MAKSLTEKILEYLSQNYEANSLDLAKLFNEEHQKIIGAIKSLETVEDLITLKQISQQKWEITAEGQQIVKHGSPEANVYMAIPENGLLLSEIMNSVPFAKIGLSKAIEAGFIELDKSSGASIVKRKISKITDITQERLMDIANLSENIKQEYKKRKLLQVATVKSILIAKGTNFSTKLEKPEAELTADLIANDLWKKKKFKPYNFDALGASLDAGHLHPLLKVRSEFKKIFIEMGFSEMPTNNYVENSFWNFDALFQPQQHPARDAHDTFFISEPKVSTKFPKEYLERIKKIHSIGDYGSTGYGYEWKIEEAEKNLLRTHTTAVSARILYNLMQNGEFKPGKFFSIDRVFRNETLDATHLAEFHQVEGVVASYNLTLGDLIGIIYEFFKKLGITQLEFKPAYNPYTEPSMEIFCYHDGLEKWIEIGNSGMFRPEMLLPMGIPNNVNVLGFGLSLERPTMIKYGLNNIRDLVGPKVDMEIVHANPICRLDKPSQKSLSKRIEEYKEKNVINTDDKTDERLLTIEYNVSNIEQQNLVIFCDPNYPIYSLEPLLQAIKGHFRVILSVYTHSSVKEISKDLTNFCSEFNRKIVNPEIDITLIWKNVGIDPIMKLFDMQNIMGEINVIRYLNRIIEAKNPTLLIYESNGVKYANQIDMYLEIIHCILHGNKRETFDEINIKTNNILDRNISIVEFMVGSLKKHQQRRKMIK
ncbi:phenylalanine--tRNA ligase alpha subunit [Prorops nasuta]|uniref:phenylalanine--tRNA ligase alpha subunit n=1 Tax=Prorops nasuta TaxID=863751 RepID=UPI0034CF1375